MKNKISYFLLLTFLITACKEKKTFRPTSRFQLHGNVKKIVVSQLQKPSNTEIEKGTEWYSDGKIDSSKYVMGDDRLFTIYEYQKGMLKKTTSYFTSQSGDPVTLTYPLHMERGK